MLAFPAFCPLTVGRIAVVYVPVDVALVCCLPHLRIRKRIRPQASRRAEIPNREGQRLHSLERPFQPTVGIHQTSVQAVPSSDVSATRFGSARPATTRKSIGSAEVLCAGSAKRFTI